MDLNVVSKDFGRSLSKNSPTILTFLAVTGLISTVVMAVKATKPALTIIEEEQRFRFEEDETKDEDAPIEFLDVVELTWKCYLPSALTGLITVGCIIGANHISLRRNAALASLFSMAESTLREYQTKVVETIGEKKEESIRSEIAQDRLNQNPPNEKTVIITGEGKYLCYDFFSKRYFRSNIEFVRQAVNKFNQRLNIDGWLNINYFYDLLGLEGIELGDEFGWMAERGLLDVKYDTRSAPDTHEPALVLDYMVRPHHI